LFTIIPKKRTPKSIDSTIREVPSQRCPWLKNKYPRIASKSGISPNINFKDFIIEGI